MAIKFQAPDALVPQGVSPRITVIGVGGAGGNAVNNMIQSHLEGVEFLVANTDAQALAQAKTERRIQLGNQTTGGLGAGSRPDMGQAAAEESLAEIMAEIEGSHMAFITAGMGGGTGTGAAPVIAHAAKERGILTVGVVTKPFQFEGVHRMRLAEQGIEELQKYVDTLIVIPNQNLFRIANEKTTFAEAFGMADEVLHAGVRGVTDLMVMPGMINLDFADIKTVMQEMGKAVMGTGEAEGERRAVEAAEKAISNPLLEDITMRGATGVLINITGGMDMGLFEVDEAANRIRDEVDANANIIFGSTFREDLEGRMRVSVVATGIEQEVAEQPEPVELTMEDAVADQAAEERKSVVSFGRPAAAASLQAKPAAAQAFTRQAQAPQMAASGGGAPLPPSQPAPRVEPAPAQAAPSPQATPAASAGHAAEVAKRVQRTLSEAAAAAESQKPAFIPQQPARPDTRPVAAPNPFKPKEAPATAEAEGGQLANAASRAGSLFDRVMGRKQTGAEVDAPQHAQHPQVPTQPQSPAPQAPQQGHLDIRPADRPVTSSAQDEDDLLDIPSFLRRQAN